MSFRKISQTVRNQSGTYGHTERQILIAIIGIGLAIYLPNHRLGFWPALLITLKWEAIIIGSIVALFFGVWGIGRLIHRLSELNSKK